MPFVGTCANRTAPYGRGQFDIPNLVRYPAHQQYHLPPLGKRDTMSTTTDHVRDCAACGWPLGDDCFTGAEATFCRICEDHANQQAIHVGDPVTREEVAVTRGDTTIYFIR